MASGGVVQLFVAVILACLFEQVAAFDGGDAAALIIGLIIGIMGICACLGAYARRQQGVWTMLEGVRRTIIELGCTNRENEVLNKCFKTVMWNLLLYTHGSSCYLLSFWFGHILGTSSWFFICTCRAELSNSTSPFGFYFFDPVNLGRTDRRQICRWRLANWLLISNALIVTGFERTNNRTVLSTPPSRDCSCGRIIIASVLPIIRSWIIA